jgi:hypothetical protein
MLRFQERFLLPIYDHLLSTTPKFRTRAKPLFMRGSRMLDWLAGAYAAIGVSGRNWMLVIGSGLLLYIAAFAISHKR